MALYRAKPEDGVAWVTGASSGIGRQVALNLAAEGYVVAATARSVDSLKSLEAETAGRKGRVVAFPGDLTDEEATRLLLREIEDKLGAVVLGVFNAGNYFPTRGDSLEVGNFKQTYEINVFGTLHGLVPLANRMYQRGRGQVAIVGSVSAYGGLPTASAYGASKAALNNMAAALKFDFDKMNIRIQIINPGFIDTPLTEKNAFPMPALMPVDKAAARIVRGLRSGGFEVTFPRRFTWALKVINLLPHWAYFPLMTRLMGWNRRPLKAPRPATSKHV